jgi:hypothetical protein
VLAVQRLKLVLKVEMAVMVVFQAVRVALVV